MQTHSTFQKVYAYYWAHLEELQSSERFHFIHRLAKISQDQKAVTALSEIQQKMNGKSKEEVWEYMRSFFFSPSPMAYAADRAVFFDKHPLVRPAFYELCMVVFSRDLFAVDLQEKMSFSGEDLRAARDAVWNDKAAVKTLYASAVNFLLTATHFLNDHNKDVLSQELFEFAASAYDRNASPKELEQWIYFVTHIIIADSFYYTWELPQEKQTFYLQIIKEIEGSLHKHYFWAHLDLKCEFLVCCKMCNYTSFLADIIFDEAEHSLSTKGDFLVDTLNINPQEFRSEFNSSEHRNVLYLSAFSAK